MVAGQTGVSNVAAVRFFDPNKYTLWVEVNGKKYAIAQYNSTFALNEIPTASCTLATGERITQGKGGVSFSPAEELAAELSGVGFAEAKVVLDLDGSDWEPNSLGYPDGFQGQKTIFEGYYAGLSYRRVGSKIQLTASLVHKLVDLTFGSIFSANMHPSNPASLVNDAVSEPLGGCQAAVAGSGGSQGVWTMTSFLGGGLPAAANARGSDPGFGAQLIEVLKCCAKLNLFSLSCNPDIGRGAANGAAMAVLERIASETGDLSAPLNGIPFTTSISSYIAAQLNSFRGTSFWDLLVNKWCPDFMLAISPLPGKTDGGWEGDYAAIIPNMPTQRNPLVELYLNDYVTFEMQSSQHKPLMAVGVFAPAISSTGATWKSAPTQPDKGSICIGGKYPTDKLDVTGQFLALDAPMWLQSTLVSSAGAGAFVNGGNTSSDPNAQNGVRPVTYTKNKTAINEALDKLAHTYYVANALRGRRGSFGSKLRFDIAPGTIVKLNAEKDPTSQGGAAKSLPVSLYGQVSRVTYNINSDAPVARTDFDIVATRNEAENKDSDYTLSQHPFFGSFWNGSTLVKDWDFTRS